MTRFPSIKTLMTLKDVDRPTARLIRKIAKTESRADLEQLLEREVPKAWLRIRHYHTPAAMTTMRLEAFDVLLNTCGVERLYLGVESGREVTSGGGLEDRWLCSYCNAGDLYASTLLLVRDRRHSGVANWRVGCRGDLPEVNA